MHYRPIFVTNSSSSCMIIWEKDPSSYPKDMQLYNGGYCPHCKKPILLGDSRLDRYMDDQAKAVVTDKLLKGAVVFYKIEYLGSFAEDECEHGTDSSGWYSFQC